MSKEIFSESMAMAEKLEQLKHLSIHFRFPKLTIFPFVGFHPYNDMFSIFRFKPMKNLSLDISKILRSFHIKMFFDEQRANNAIVSSLRTPKNLQATQANCY